MLHLFYILFSLVDKKKTSIEVCESIAILLHFFLIGTFLVMFSMSVLTFIKISYPLKTILINYCCLISSIGSICNNLTNLFPQSILKLSS